MNRLFFFFIWIFFRYFDLLFRSLSRDRCYYSKDVECYMNLVRVVSKLPRPDVKPKPIPWPEPDVITAPPRPKPTFPFPRPILIIVFPRPLSDVV